MIGKQFTEQLISDVRYVLDELSKKESTIISLRAELDESKRISNKLRDQRNEAEDKVKVLESKLESAKLKLTKSVAWIEQVKVGPAITMAEPKSVWYSTHSERVLKEISEIKI